MADNSRECCQPLPVQAPPCEKQGCHRRSSQEKSLSCTEKGPANPCHPPKPSVLVPSPEGQAHQSQQVTLFSWNIGGKPIDDALKAIDHSLPSCAIRSSIISLQELPPCLPRFGKLPVKQEIGYLSSIGMMICNGEGTGSSSTQRCTHACAAKQTPLGFGSDSNTKNQAPRCGCLQRD